MSDAEIFEDLCSRIVQAERNLGHTQSWSFLYTPKSTFSRDQKLMFVGLNPGGNEEKYEPETSSEDGNAYLLEKWKDKEAGQSPLQKQVQALYIELQKNINSSEPEKDYKELMNSSLAMNYIPFRSRSRNSLKNPEETLQFCHGLWIDILDHIKPEAIVTIDTWAYREIRKIFENQNYHIETQREQIGWGKVTYTIDTLSKNGHSAVLLKLPHLSRYQIFSSEKCKAAREKAIQVLADAIKR